MQPVSKYYNEGALAFNAGKPITYNPYPMSVWNPHHNLWRRGWTDAHNELKNPTKPIFNKLENNLDLF